MTTQTFIRRVDTGGFVALDKATDGDLAHAAVLIATTPATQPRPTFDVDDARRNGTLVRYGSTFGKLYEWRRVGGRLVRIPADLTTDDAGRLPADVLELLLASFGAEYVAELAAYLARRAAVEGPVTTRKVDA